MEGKGKGIPVPVSINNEKNNLWLTFSFLEIVNVRKWVVVFLPPYDISQPHGSENPVKIILHQCIYFSEGGGNNL